MSTTNYKTVFIVDDDRLTLEGLQSHVPWSKMRLRVLDTAENGMDALRKIREAEEKPKIVMTDIYMPEMDGFSFIQELKKEEPDIRIIILSGYEEFENARQAMRFGVQHFLLKPANVQEIEFVLREVVQEIDIEREENTIKEKYIQQFTDNLPRIKDSFFREMLVTRYKPEEISPEKLQLIELESDSQLIVASIQLVRPHYLGRDQERHWQLMKFAAGNIINEIVSEDNGYGNDLVVQTVDFTDEMFVAILMLAREADLEAIAVSLSSQILEKILLYLKISAVVGVGKQKQGLDQIIDSYLESQGALETAAYSELNQVYKASEAGERGSPQALTYPLTYVQQIHEALDRQDIAMFLENWELMNRQLDAHRLPLYMLQTIYISVLSSMLLAYSTVDPEKSAEYEMSRMLKEMYQQPTAMQLKQWMDAFIDSWKEGIEAGRESNYLIKQVKEWVSAHYCEQVAFHEIAQSLYVSRAYLSHLFKRVTGETFTQYLMNYRIGKATELLRTKQYMIYEVSVMVGYQNPTYFSQIFKSVIGCSPTDYLNRRS
jgi:two-component system response regulator YesN